MTKLLFFFQGHFSETSDLCFRVQEQTVDWLLQWEQWILPAFGAHSSLGDRMHLFLNNMTALHFHGDYTCILLFIQMSMVQSEVWYLVPRTMTVYSRDLNFRPLLLLISF